jgi:L-amino acid N-acyltransferase YncA
LKECQEAVIRPLEHNDRKLLEAFYTEIPLNDRWLMRYDVLDPKIMQKWFDGIGQDYVTSIIALCNQQIVGHGSLHKRSHGSTRHVGRFRILVLPEYRQQRLGTWLLLDLIQLAMDKGLETLRTDLVRGMEDAAIEAVVKFDFFKEAVLRDYVKDRDGHLHDLLIMIKRLHKDWSDY